MRIDQVMIGNILTSKDVGIYSVAIRLSELWYFVPTAIVVSVFPSIINSKKFSVTQYLSRLQNLYSLLTWMGIAFGVFMSFNADLFITLLFGKAYIESSSILVITVWSGVFAIQGVARRQWMIVENLQKYFLWYFCAGAAVNVILNLFFNPCLKTKGAAIATLISQFTVAIIAPALFRKTRLSSIMLLKSFFPSFIFWKR